jgi:hypothetical protein
MDIQPDPHEFTRDAWEANADIWDARMGEDGNDFFNMAGSPSPLLVPAISMYYR